MKIIKNIINWFNTFQIFIAFKYLEKKFDKYPITKKKIKEEIEAPIPKNIFWLIRKFLEKFPKKNTVSE